ncbi:MAG TPA: SIMPL domain-containing protein [Bryobacteraceae bacterium]|nr:SIMPL domain-containing protein [Bryobacteraceae bacterium]
MKIFALAAVLGMATLGALPAQQNPAQAAPASVRATAEATVSATPDRARIHIGVVTQAPNAQAAAAENAKQLDAVLAALRKVLGPQAAVRTIGYSVNPNMRYPREGGAPVITGYTAQNTVEVTTDDLKLVPRVIDTATQFGANSVQSLQFMLRDERPVRARALRQAAEMARADAEAMAAAVGLRVVGVLTMEEGERPPVRPLMRENAMLASAPDRPTPVEPGSLEVRAVVTLTMAAQ